MRFPYVPLASILGLSVLLGCKVRTRESSDLQGRFTEPSLAGEFPWTGRILTVNPTDPQKRLEVFCTGTRIPGFPCSIVTANHCIDFDEVFFEDQREGQTRRFRIQSDQATTRPESDLAVASLEGCRSETEESPSFCLAKEHLANFSVESHFVGYGATTHSEDSDGIQRWGKFKLVHTTPHTAFNSKELFYEAYKNEAGQVACAGDSGGPVMSADRRQLLGVVSAADHFTFLDFCIRSYDHISDPALPQCGARDKAGPQGCVDLKNRIVWARQDSFATFRDALHAQGWTDIAAVDFFCKPTLEKVSALEIELKDQAFKKFNSRSDYSKAQTTQLLEGAKESITARANALRQRLKHVWSLPSSAQIQSMAFAKNPQDYYAVIRQDLEFGRSVHFDTKEAHNSQYLQGYVYISDHSAGPNGFKAARVADGAVESFSHSSNECERAVNTLVVPVTETIIYLGMLQTSVPDCKR